MRPTVLVIEDYEDLRLAIAQALERNHYGCDAVKSPEDAIVKLRDHQYEAILISPRLPIADDPVVHYLAEHRPGDVAKIIVMSDPATPTGQCRGLLEKPFTNQQLLAMLPVYPERSEGSAEQVGLLEPKRTSPGK
jgi:DNA-binding response OmpR family regulator